VIIQIIKLVTWYWGTLLIKDKVSVKNSPWKPSRCGSSSQCVLLGLKICNKCSDVERFTEGTELMGAAEVQLQSDLIR